MSQAQGRPSHKELSKKLRGAAKRLSDGDWMVALEREIFKKDCEELGLYTAEDLARALKEVMKEIAPDHYIGSYPPLTGSRGAVLKMDLFEFRFQSKFLKEEIYFKFAVDENELFVVSFHKTRK